MLGPKIPCMIIICEYETRSALNPVYPFAPKLKYSKCYQMLLDVFGIRYRNCSVCTHCKPCYYYHNHNRLKATITAIINEMYKIVSNIGDMLVTYGLQKQVHPKITVSDYESFLTRLTSKTDYRQIHMLVNDEIIGIIGFHSDFYLDGQIHMYIREFVISREHRGKGYGKELLSHVEEYARESGYDAIWLTTDNLDIVEFYDKRGYTSGGIWMSKVIQS